MNNCTKNCVVPYHCCTSLYQIPQNCTMALQATIPWFNLTLRDCTKLYIPFLYFTLSEFTSLSCSKCGMGPLYSRDNGFLFMGFLFSMGAYYPDFSISQLQQHTDPRLADTIIQPYTFTANPLLCFNWKQAGTVHSPCSDALPEEEWSPK